MFEKDPIIKKFPKYKRKKEFLAVFLLSILSISLIFYYTYNTKTLNVPNNLPRVYITCQHHINKFNYRDCVIDVDKESTRAEIKVRGWF